MQLNPTPPGVFLVVCVFGWKTRIWGIPIVSYPSRLPSPHHQPTPRRASVQQLIAPPEYDGRLTNAAVECAAAIDAAQ